jgi:hypothetical protein
MENNSICIFNFNLRTVPRMIEFESHASNAFINTNAIVYSIQAFTYIADA